MKKPIETLEQLGVGSQGSLSEYVMFTLRCEQARNQCVSDLNKGIIWSKYIYMLFK